jgi:sec-independent protein translocase protein TatA
MFGLSFEHLLIIGVVLLIFGPRRLPELGHTMGAAIRNFQKSVSGDVETPPATLSAALLSQSGVEKNAEAGNKAPAVEVSSS